MPLPNAWLVLPCLLVEIETSRRIEGLPYRVEHGSQRFAEIYCFEAFDPRGRHDKTLTVGCASGEPVEDIADAQLVVLDAQQSNV